MNDQKPKLYIVLYSLYHHVYKLAKEVAKGAEASGCQVRIFQVEETLSNDVLEKMSAPDRPNLPIISPIELAEADGILFGLPTRFGMFPTQVKTLLDATGSLWLKNGLAQKFAGFFVSTASSHGGSETTALTAVSYLVHHSINYIPFGYPNPALFDNSKVIGGTPYGASTIANGDGSRQPIDEELELAFNQGENFGIVLATYHRGVKKLQLGGGDALFDEEKADVVPDNTNTQNVSPSTSNNNTDSAAVATATAATGGAIATAGLEASKKNNIKNKPDPRPSTESYGGDDTFYGSVMGALSTESSGVKKKQPNKSNNVGAATLDGQQQSHLQNNADQTTGTNTLGRNEEDGLPTAEATQTQARPRSIKKKFLWFCCGNDNDLD